MRRLGGEHRGLDRAVAALDARGVEESGLVADQRPAGEHELRQRLQPAGGNRARSIADALSAFEGLADLRMGLEALELLERRKVGILVAEADDEADRDQPVFHVINERAAVDVGVQRPAGGMRDQPRLVALRLHLPQLLQADAVHLGSFS